MMKSDSQIIHEARVDEDGKALCWHDVRSAFMKDDRYFPDKCLTCGEFYNHFCDYIPNPDYPTDYAEYLKALLEFKRTEWWIDFICKHGYAEGHQEPDDGEHEGRGHWETDKECIDTNLLDPKLGVPILAKYLREVVKGDE